MKPVLPQVSWIFRNHIPLNFKIQSFGSLPFSEFWFVTFKRIPPKLKKKLNSKFIAMRLFEIFNAIMMSHTFVRIQILSATVIH